jgi:molybdopterin-biosynthesis enzyme MoeA-like protein
MLFEGDPEPTPPEGLVTVGRFESPLEAQMAKGMLESAGVECVLVGENANNLMQSAFRVRLQVKVEDEAAARELMAQPAGDQAAEGVGEG